ncbi:hypothetical protein [Methylobacterium sp. 10]|uniref:hypothetical protein n=1 Tax=Methylobacterium sp. 10 TaxID=1101191 RepID=UPI000488F164|nr:hypothetical protein [Methylobacterium sp. 10]
MDDADDLSGSGNADKNLLVVSGSIDQEARTDIYDVYYLKPTPLENAYDIIRTHVAAALAPSVVRPVALVPVLNEIGFRAAIDE